MGIVRDRLASLRIRTQSPDRSVFVELTRGEGIAVDFEEHLLRGHNDRSLSEQLEVAVTGALIGYAQAVEMIKVEAYGLAADTTPHGRAAELHRAYEEAGEVIEVQSASPGGCVRALWSGKNDIQIQVKNGTLRRLDTHALIGEVNAAIAELVTARSKAISQIQKSAYFDRSTR